MASRRDVAAFDARAASHEDGWLGRMHREIADRTAAVSLSGAPSPGRILDVGCGTGYLLGVLAERCPDATALDGVDPAPAMVKLAAALSSDVFEAADPDPSRRPKTQGAHEGAGDGIAPGRRPGGRRLVYPLIDAVVATGRPIR